ncbi:Amino-acid permease RocE [Bacillus licheniformis]|nr:Amino-acid permease RocE [Bacillus licheniformis]
MNFVILIALLSVANSGLYASTRMLYSLAKEGMAAQALSRVNKRGIPMNALWITLGFAGLSLISSVVAAETLYIWLLSLAGLSAQVGWITITVSQLLFRRRYVKEGGKVEDLKFKTPLYPYLPLTGFILNSAVLVSLAFDSEQRMALYCGILFMSACYFVYHVFVKKRQALDRQEAMIYQNKTNDEVVIDE